MERTAGDDLAVVGPWAREKLDALGEYLKYYTTRLSNQRWKTIYIDAFAGGGLARVRTHHGAPAPPLFPGELPIEEAQYIAGSPRVALQVARPFDSYIFIEQDPARVQDLRALRAEHPDRRITVREDNADAGIAWALGFQPSRRSHRGVAFLDPFGAHLSWSTVRALAETRLFEVIVNFPLDMCLNRLVTRDPASMRESWKAQLDAFLPPGWFDVVYGAQSGLFGERMWKRLDARTRLLSWYHEHLREAFGFASDARLISNTQGAPLYHLIWAGPHPAGLVGAQHIMKLGRQG